MEEDIPARFKAGDRVTVISKDFGHYAQTGTVVDGVPNPFGEIKVRFADGAAPCYEPQHLRPALKIGDEVSYEGKTGFLFYAKVRDVRLIDGELKACVVSATDGAWYTFAFTDVTFVSRPTSAQTGTPCEEEPIPFPVDPRGYDEGFAAFRAGERFGRTGNPFKEPKPQCAEAKALEMTQMQYEAWRNNR